MTNFEKIKQMSVEDMAEMLLAFGIVADYLDDLEVILDE